LQTFNGTPTRISFVKTINITVAV